MIPPNPNNATRLGFLWPWGPDEVWTDQAVARLVGQEFDLQDLGGPGRGRGRIIDATNLPERKGVWVLLERIEGESHNRG